VIDRAVEAIRAGRPVILPTDTVYGLCTTASSAQAVEALYRLKGRPGTQPTAILAGDLDALFEAVPELRASERILRALLPGPYTLVLPNPARRFPWLNGRRTDAIGVRVPELCGDAAAVVRRVGAVVATSANLAGGPESRSCAATRRRWCGGSVPSSRRAPTSPAGPSREPSRTCRRSSARPPQPSSTAGSCPASPRR